jgi:hypothetical protein
MKKLLILFFVSGTLVFTQCKKYPEGPAISLRSKQERIANTWKVSKYLENSVDKTSDFNTIFNNYVLTTTKGGDYTITYKALSLANYSESGSWSLSSDKEDITFTQSSPNNGSVTTWKILKLYEKEFWAKSVDANGKITEVHLVP